MFFLRSRCEDEVEGLLNDDDFSDMMINVQLDFSDKKHMFLVDFVQFATCKFLKTNLPRQHAIIGWGCCWSVPAHVSVWFLKLLHPGSGWPPQNLKTPHEILNIEQSMGLLWLAVIPWGSISHQDNLPWKFLRRNSENDWKHQLVLVVLEIYIWLVVSTHLKKY